MALRVGIAGYGLAGRYFHAPLLKGCGFDLVGIQTSNAERKSHALADFPSTKVVATVEELVALGLDLVVVASANVAHAHDAYLAIDAGIPVVVDKPMGRTYEETKAIIDYAQKANVPVTTFFNRRWDSDALTIKKVIASGVLGEIFRLDSRFERFRPDVNNSSWRETMSPADGGGQLIDLQPHLISTSMQWLGTPELVSSSVRSIRGGADDDSVLVIKLDPQEDLLRSGKYPEGGTWTIPSKSKTFIYRGDQVEEIDSEPGNYAHFYLEVAGAIAGKNAWPVSTQDALLVAKIIDQARAQSIHG